MDVIRFFGLAILLICTAVIWVPILILLLIFQPKTNHNYDQQ
jgi:hypothetical protein